MTTTKAVKQMAEFRPTNPFATPMILMKPKSFEKSGGVRKAIFPPVEEGELIFGTFRSFGGTETTVNGVYSIIDTADVETWFRPDINSDCMIVLAESGEKYQILNQPENLYRRNQFMKFKVRRIKGGA